MRLLLNEAKYTASLERIRNINADLQQLATQRPRAPATTSSPDNSTTGNSSTSETAMPSQQNRNSNSAPLFSKTVHIRPLPSEILDLSESSNRHKANFNDLPQSEASFSQDEQTHATSLPHSTELANIPVRDDNESIVMASESTGEEPSRGDVSSLHSVVQTLRRPLRLLSLGIIYTSVSLTFFAYSNPDGGGVRGISSLVILKQLMTNLAKKGAITNDTLPSEYFDLIAGTSTGG